MLNISIYFNDIEYSAALAKVMAAGNKEYVFYAAEDAENALKADIVVCNGSDAGKFGDKAFVFDSGSVSIASKALRVFVWKDSGASDHAVTFPVDVQAMCFVSDRHAESCSSAAALAGRILSRLYGRKVLLISLSKINRFAVVTPFDTSLLLYKMMSHRFDSKNADAFVRADEYGLYRPLISGVVNPLAGCGEKEIDDYAVLMSNAMSLDHIIFDIPFESQLATHCIEMCEHAISVSCGHDEVFEKYLGDRFANAFEHICMLPCGDADDCDIHGANGGRVLELLRSLGAGV